jgi:ribosomal protein S18 acetylase RimI-like enzyme
MITDNATFAYLTDVYVLPEYQGRGLGRWLIECVAEVFHPTNMPCLRRIMLVTGDQRMQDFYQKIFGMKVVGQEVREDMGKMLTFLCARPDSQS